MPASGSNHHYGAGSGWPRSFKSFVLLLLGPPGSGKGTQAARISEWLKIPAISTGEMLRAESASGSELGNQVAAVLASGNLVGDELVNAMLVKRLAQPDCRSGFLLDGYPRTVSQAKFLNGVLERACIARPFVIHLDVDPAILIRRISSRRQCPSCGRIYNLLRQPSDWEPVCEMDRLPLIRRNDDQEEVVRERLSEYAEHTSRLISLYQGPNYFRLSGDGAPDEITHEIESRLEPLLMRVRNRSAS